MRDLRHIPQKYPPPRGGGNGAHECPRWFFNVAPRPMEECIDRPKNKGVVNQFRQRHSRPLGPKWGLSSRRLGLWDKDKNDKNGKSAYKRISHLKEHYIFFGTFLYLHCTTTTWNPRFLFFLLKLNEVSINSTPRNFADTWQVKWFGIIAMKVKGPNTFYWCRFKCRRRCCELRNQRRLN